MFPEILWSFMKIKFKGARKVTLIGKTTEVGYFGKRMTWIH